MEQRAGGPRGGTEDRPAHTGHPAFPGAVPRGGEGHQPGARRPGRHAAAHGRASLHGPLHGDRDLAPRAQRSVRPVQPHLRLPGPRLEQPPEHAPEPAVPGRRRVRAPACGPAGAAAADPGHFRQLPPAGRPAHRLAGRPYAGLPAPPGAPAPADGPVDPRARLHPCRLHPRRVRTHPGGAEALRYGGRHGPALRQLARRHRPFRPRRHRGARDRPAGMPDDGPGRGRSAGGRGQGPGGRPARRPGGLQGPAGRGTARGVH